jgi:hypothetical protein
LPRTGHREEARIGFLFGADEVGLDSLGSVCGMHSDDDPLIATIEEEIADSETEAAFNPKPSKNLLEIGSTDGDRFIKRSRKCTADKSGNGCGYSTDGWHTNWDLFDVNAGVGRHGTVLTLKESPLTGIISMGLALAHLVAGGEAGSQRPRASQLVEQSNSHRCDTL